MSFLKSLTSNSNKFDKPFPHWELNNPLSEEAINEIIKADIANPNEHKLEYDGTRAIDGGEGKFREGISTGGKALKFRCFVTKENSKDFPGLSNFIMLALKISKVTALIELSLKDLKEFKETAHLKSYGRC